MTNRILIGECREQLATLPEKSVHCCVTSPPYWALRSYLDADHPDKCYELGCEPTPEEYVANMVDVFRAVWRVLRDDGVLWLNLGDSYASGGRTWRAKDRKNPARAMGYRPDTPEGLKPKDLVGIPWRVAFALQADGWVLRSDVVWSKANPMPESVRDRPTKAHEYIFMFCKGVWSGPPALECSYISDADARWLALLLDTEGNIVMKKSESKSGRVVYGLQIAFANTSRDLMETARGIARMGCINERPGVNAPVVYWQVSNLQARSLLARIYPYMIVKRDQARLGIHAQTILSTSDSERRTKIGRSRGRLRSDEYTAQLDSFWKRMKSLNQFGNPDLSDIPDPQYGRWATAAKYYYDAEAVKEPYARQYGDDFGVGANGDYSERGRADAKGWRGDGGLKTTVPGSGRNRRSVWTVTTEPFSGAHFATFPRKLIEPCILAGTSAKGCCPDCGAPWERVVEKQSSPRDYDSPVRRGNENGWQPSCGNVGLRPDHEVHTRTVGWRPTCDCDAGDPIPCTVLDPFLGAGTVGLVCEQLGRDWIGVELNPEYAKLAQDRITAGGDLRAKIANEKQEAAGQVPLFDA